MDSITRVEYTPNFGDYLRFQKTFRRRSFRVARAIAILFTICFLLAPWIPSEGNPSLLMGYRDYLFALIVPGMVFVIVPLCVYIGTRRQWKRAAELHEPRIYEFSDAGLSTTGRSFSGSTQWANLRRAETNGPVVVLFTRQRAGYFIPLSAIGDAQQVEALKSLLRRNVPDCKRL